jgi:hypothetical protein
MNHTVPHHEPARAPVLRQSQGNGSAAPAASHEQIAKLAHEIYVKGGSVEGHCQRNWMQAEQELQQQMLHQKQDAELVMQNEGGSSSTVREQAAEATTAVHAAVPPSANSAPSASPGIHQGRQS